MLSILSGHKHRQSKKSIVFLKVDRQQIFIISVVVRLVIATAFLSGMGLVGCIFPTNKKSDLLKMKMNQILINPNRGA